MIHISKPTKALTLMFFCVQEHFNIKQGSMRCPVFYVKKSAKKPYAKKWISKQESE